METKDIIKTADFSHLTLKDYEHVYEPSEDSFLLIDALEKDFNVIKLINPKLCLEVGSGSGIVITSFAKALGSTCKYISTDINPKACEITSKTGKQNAVNIETICCDLVSELPNYCTKSIDVILFNPPYVVTSSEEVGTGDLEYTWAGGIKGREVMDRFFPYLKDILSENGLFYLVALKQNCVDEIFDMLKVYGLYGVCILSRKCGIEHLSILRFSYKNYDLS